jgi:threonine/homoserine/homoserine lactone efflux protein
MELIKTFLLALVFSFLGSIPPGTLNLTVLHLGLSQKMNVAWRFAIAAALVEYPYAWAAVKFEKLITSSPVIEQHFELIASLVMTVVGILHLWSAYRPTALAGRFEDSGFRKGIVMSLLNPLALPFWVAITAYLRSQHWLSLENVWALHAYLAGISLGALLLLMGVAYLANYLMSIFKPGSAVKRIPGYVLIALGLYAFVRYLM